MLHRPPVVSKLLLLTQLPLESLSARVTMSLNTVTVLGLTIRFSRCCAVRSRLTSVPLSATALPLYSFPHQMSSLFLKKLYFFYFSIFSFICLSFSDHSLCFSCVSSVYSFLYCAKFPIFAIFPPICALFLILFLQLITPLLCSFPYCIIELEVLK